LSTTSVDPQRRQPKIHVSNREITTTTSTIKMQKRDRGLVQALGLPLAKRVKDSRVLVVGAGGIGCELLKNLVCAGFGSGYTQSNLGAGDNKDDEALVTTLMSRAPGIVLVDLDTIDLSNLNRQFLFRKQHIKKPKATVAKETASQFNPTVNIDARHGDIFDSEFNVEFFQGFDIVFNALDNLKARQHVNRMCMAADVALIESGTTGFNGQVQAIQKGMTECYDCNPKPVQKSFPICTIRSTPSQPIHCIVWAKSYLFPELFGTSEGDSDLTVTDTDDAEEVVKLREEAQALKKIRSLMGTNEFAQAVFDKVFYDDIERLRSMSEMWQSRSPPQSLRFDSLKADTDLVKQGQALAGHDQRLWSVEENLAVFCYSLDTLSSRSQAGEQEMSFDKDDKDTLDFVSAAANLRSHIFGIPTNSEWEIKQMAGNIIPAIATSNALTASLSVMLSYKVLRSQAARTDAMAKPTANNSLPTATLSNKDDTPLGGSKMVFLNSKSTERTITSQGLGQPNPRCPVCSPVYAQVRIPQNTVPTLQDLVDELKKQLNYEEFQIGTSIGVVYEPDLDDNLPRPLTELGVNLNSNSFITVTDDSDEPRVDLILSTSSHNEENGKLQLELLDSELPMKPKPEVLNQDLKNGDTRIDDLMPSAAAAPRGQAMHAAYGPATTGHSDQTQAVLDDAASGSKRKRDFAQDMQLAQKRAKPDDTVLVDDGPGGQARVDGSHGAILLDDD
jgi:ubiquitin-like 1-activating enzyme E1 B